MNTISPRCKRHPGTLLTRIKRSARWRFVRPEFLFRRRGDHGVVEAISRRSHSTPPVVVKQNRVDPERVVAPVAAILSGSKHRRFHEPPMCCRDLGLMAVIPAGRKMRSPNETMRSPNETRNSGRFTIPAGPSFPRRVNSLMNKNTMTGRLAKPGAMGAAMGWLFFLRSGARVGFTISSAGE